MNAMFAALSVAVLGTSPAVGQALRAYDDRPKITVTGEAVVTVKPDKVVVNLGIETWDGDIVAAKKKNGEVLGKAAAVMKRLGVPAKEIQTDHLSIEPRWRDDYQKRDFLGFFARNSVSVTVADAAKVEELITEALKAGVNYIHGVEFQTTELKRYREQAREMALKAAKEKADKMAAVLARSVGEAIEVNEHPAHWWHWSAWSGWGYGRSQGMSQNVAQNAGGGGGDAGEGIALGKLSVRASVGVVFELK